MPNSSDPKVIGFASGTSAVEIEAARVEMVLGMEAGCDCDKFSAPESGRKLTDEYRRTIG